MPTRIRICNESEARLMVQDGSFLDYLRHWDEQFPQTRGMEWISRFGYSIMKVEGSGLNKKEYFDFCKVCHIDNTVLFEIGESIILKKEDGMWSPSQKIDNIWVCDWCSPNLETILEFLDEILLCPCHRTEVLVSEMEIRKSRNPGKLARQLARHHMEPGCYYKFGNKELWEVDEESEIIRVYGEGLPNCSMRMDLKDIESHIRKYGKTTQVSH